MVKLAIVKVSSSMPLCCFSSSEGVFDALMFRLEQWRRNMYVVVEMPKKINDQTHRRMERVNEHLSLDDIMHHVQHRRQLWRHDEHPIDVGCAFVRFHATNAIRSKNATRPIEDIRGSGKRRKGGNKQKPRLKSNLPKTHVH